MKLVLLLGLLIVTVAAIPALDDLLKKVPKTTQQLVDMINKDDKIPFTAQVYERFANKLVSQLKRYGGAAVDPEIEQAKAKAASRRRRPRQAGWGTTASPVEGTTTSSGLPVNFTVSDNWSQCASVFNTITDQSECSDCWAVSTASVMSDRRCIVKGTGFLPISAWDITSCCIDCHTDQGDGCDIGGGYTALAFKFFGTTGAVTGGAYGTKTTCKPFQVSPTAKSAPTSTPCSKTCQSQFNGAYSTDKKKGGTYKIFSNQNDEVMQEIYNNGPVVITFKLYEDIMTYKSGVYQYTEGDYIGGHAARIVGWGETMDGTPYWRVANSWGTGWGENGFINFLRGYNECDCEDGIIAGTVL